jgi:hypothetical protein
MKPISHLDFVDHGRGGVRRDWGWTGYYRALPLSKQAGDVASDAIGDKSHEHEINT